jgi:hypothetical protein
MPKLRRILLPLSPTVNTEAANFSNFQDILLQDFMSDTIISADVIPSNVIVVPPSSST